MLYSNLHRLTKALETKSLDIYHQELGQLLEHDILNSEAQLVLNSSK